MSFAGFLPDPTNQGKDHQGRVEDEEKDVQEGIHQWGIAERLRFQVHPPQQGFDVSKTQGEPMVQSDSVTDDFRRKAEALIK